MASELSRNASRWRKRQQARRATHAARTDARGVVSELFPGCGPSELRAMERELNRHERQQAREALAKFRAACAAYEG